MGFIRRHPALLLGLGITVVFLGFGFFRIDFIDALELKLYDMMVNLRTNPAAPSEIVLVDIDDDSIEKLGRWPWPRSLMAEGIRKISSGKPKVIGFSLILAEPQESAGLKEIVGLENLFVQIFSDPAGEKTRLLLQAIRAAEKRLDNDTRLAETIRTAGNVVLPVFFKESAVAAENSRKESGRLAAAAVSAVRTGQSYDTPRANEIVLPIPAFLDAADGIGHINLACDMDGKVRRERLLYRYNGIYIPAYTLRLAARYLNVSDKTIRAELGSGVYLGSLEIPVTARTEFLVGFKGPRGSFKHYSYFDVVNDKVPAHLFRDKLVLVSPSAAGILNPLSTPTDATMPVGEFSAHVLWSMLHRNFIREPSWSPALELLLIVLLGLVVTLVLPRLKALTAGLTFVLLGGLLIGGSLGLFVTQGLWVRIMYPLLLLVGGYIGVVSLKYFVTETRKEKVEGESAETNRMLGLSFQTQGMLDMAFDKFRRVPVNDEMKDILYNLALDYERKRQFNKAAAVCAYIESHDGKFKDVRTRKTKLIQASETMVFGGGLLGSQSGDGLLAAGSDTRPTLGRYEIVRQLGKGAMGVVYLGKDPRINRTTAIKTFRFTDDFKPEEIAKLKETFFREAESAGTLSHPNIVTIYDAGEEQDLAYIAMEYLEGESFEKYTQKANLLPMRRLIGYLADIADALDYAHRQGIVHRDIKPANIMLLKSEVVKITDFGIARITATSQTQTGIVKGTPFYMSPEQFSGQKVDGRSDIFSLGTMSYQLLTGVLPFQGDSPSALMHQIMNVAQPDPRKFNPKVVHPLVLVIDKALVKNRDKRYQRAAQMAAHLRQIGRKIDTIMAGRKAN